MKKEVITTTKKGNKVTAKEVNDKVAIVEVEKVDKRKDNPGRPKSEKTLEREQFLADLFENGKMFSIKGLGTNFVLEGDVLMKGIEILGKLDKVFPTKFRVKTKTMLGSSIEEVIKFEDVEIVKLDK